MKSNLENKTSNVSTLVKKTNCNTKITETEKKLTNYNQGKHITTLKFNKLTVQNFASRLAKENLITKTNFDAKLINLNKKYQKENKTCVF